MIGIKTITTSQKLNLHTCPSCQTKVHNIQIKKYFRFLFISLFKTSQREYYQCKPCNKVVAKGNTQKQPTSVQTQSVKKDGTIVKKFTHQTATKSTTTTIYDHSQVIPDVTDKALMGQTIIAIMTLMERYDPSIKLESKETYLFIKNRFETFQTQLESTQLKIQHSTIDTAKLEVLDFFEKAHQSFGTNAINFILGQCLSLTKNQFILRADVDDLFRELLTIFEIGELRHESYISELRF